jgi:anti-anti-sigma factor
MKDGNTGVLKISGTLDMDSADALREALLDCFLHQHEVAANLSEVEGCDTAALQVLLAASSNAASLGKRFHVTAASACLSDMAAALGFAIDGLASALREGHPDAA